MLLLGQQGVLEGACTLVAPPAPQSCPKQENLAPCPEGANIFIWQWGKNHDGYHDLRKELRQMSPKDTTSLTKFSTLKDQPVYQATVRSPPKVLGTGRAGRMPLFT